MVFGVARSHAVFWICDALVPLVPPYASMELHAYAYGRFGALPRLYGAFWIRTALSLIVQLHIRGTSVVYWWKALIMFGSINQLLP